MHLKTELEKQYKKQVASNLAAQGRLKPSINQMFTERATTPVGEEGASSFKMTLNKIANVAQNSIYKHSNEKQVPPMNDSLDHMKKDFLNQFNQLMLESADKSARL